MSKLINKIIYFLIIFVKFKWFGIFKLYKSDSDNVIWIFPNLETNLIHYLRGNAFLNDLALIQSFIDCNYHFRIKFGPKIGSFNNKNIFYNISKLFNYNQFVNHSAGIIFMVEELEKQNNILYPSLKELKYWENKSYMHKSFEELNISSPKTWVVSKPEDISFFENQIIFPCLLKECNSSGSLGLHKVSNEFELKKLIYEFNQNGKYEFLIQHLINIRKDLRVIFVNGEIVLHYWRINSSSEWKPTSTGHGSTVDFESFPDFWKNEILGINQKLGLRTCAFDIAWDNDDLSTVPLILEVSPSYMPNPSIPKVYGNISYSKFKNIVSFKYSYAKEYVNLVFLIKHKVFLSYFND
jgi:glutathione synthase/RimK-type ligase-like ATP-grasp enzyme